MSTGQPPGVHELLIASDELPWWPKSLPGLSEKMLWRHEETGASIALVCLEKGAGIPEPHRHASNQFMFCLSGAYEYTATGLLLTPGSFYWNPKGQVPTATLRARSTARRSRARSRSCSRSTTAPTTRRSRPGIPTSAMPASPAAERRGMCRRKRSAARSSTTRRGAACSPRPSRRRAGGSSTSPA
jgi:quercetin dioxygenase-like cupin family protein